MKKTSILLGLLFVALSSCGNPGSRPTLSDGDRSYRNDDGDRQRRDDDRRDRGDNDDGDDEGRRHWWN